MGIFTPGEQWHTEELYKLKYSPSTPDTIMHADPWQARRRGVRGVRTNPPWGPKGGEIRDTKTLNLSRNNVSLQVLVDVSRFSSGVINLIRNKNIYCGLKKCSTLIGWFAGTRANLLRDKLWVWWKTSNKAKICCSKQTRALLFATPFFNPQQMLLLPDKLITQGEKRKTSTTTCNETTLRDKFRVFVSRISPP